MNEQRQYDPSPVQSNPGDDAGAESAARLAAARAQLARITAAAESILEQVRSGDSARFLDQVRQQGGE